MMPVDNFSINAIVKPHKYGKAILVEKLSIWHLPILKVLSFFGFHIVYMFFPSRFRDYFKSADRYESFLKKWGLNKFHFCEGQGSEPYGYAKFAPLYAEKVFDSIFENVCFKGITDTFKGGENCADKVKIILYEHIVGHALSFGEFLTVAIELRKQGYRVFTFYPANRVQSYILSGQVSNFKNLYPVFLLNLGKIFGILLKVLSYLSCKLVFRLKSNSTMMDNNIKAETSKGSQEVIFFPHRGVVYGNLFIKDHFYSENPDSPFYQLNILHVELNDDLLSSSRKYYKEMGVPCVFLNMGLEFNRKNLLLLLRALRIFWENSSNVSTLKNRISAVIIMLRSYIVFIKYYNNTESFSTAKIALIGYDFLFPALLSMVLQARNIKVVGLQERLIQMYHKSFHPIFDLYFVSGLNIKKHIQQNRFHNIGVIKEIGLVRSQRLREYRSQDNLISINMGSRAKKLVVVLDFHSDRDSFSDSDNSMICWRANNEFYQDILRLSKVLPDTHFVIRGKNIEWTQIDYFKNTLAEINKSPNVELNRNYDEMDVSYKLVSKADLVIGRQTSLGDEAMAVGIPVLFHDWTPMRERNVSEIYDYEGFPIFVYSYAELERRTKEILIGEDYVNAEEFLQMREKHYFASNLQPIETMMSTLGDMLRDTDKHSERSSLF